MSTTTNTPQEITILEVATAMPELCYTDPVQVHVSGARTQR